jgi:hypothetical protein
MKILLTLIVIALGTTVYAQKTKFYIDVADTVQVRNVCSCNTDTTVDTFYDYFHVTLRKDEVIQIEIGQEYPDNRVTLTLTGNGAKKEVIEVDSLGFVTKLLIENL